MSWDEILLRLGVALVLGAVAGCDREKRGKPAGLKTYALVSFGAATFTVISLQLIAVAEDTGGPDFDPLRLVAGIIGGIGFLGAGTIIQSRGSVQGITTAAGIWVVGAIGVACGAGLFLIAGIAVGGMLVILIPLKFIERRWLRREDGKELPPDD